MRKTILLLGLFTTLVSHAGKVMQITPVGKNREVRIAHYGQVYYHWVLNDEVCILREVGAQEKVCGNVVRYDNVETVLRFPSEKVIFNEGEIVKIMYTKRTTASTPPEVKVIVKEKIVVKHEDDVKPKMNLSAGLGTGFSYLFFDVHFKYALSNKVTLGIMPVFINDSGVNSSVKAFGGFITGDYYFKEHYYGFRVESGFGFYSITAKAGALEEGSTPFAVYSTIGWRGKVNQSGVTVGGAAGFQVVANTQQTLIVDFKGFLPLVQLEVGYTF